MPMVKAGPSDPTNDAELAPIRRMDSAMSHVGSTVRHAARYSVRTIPVSAGVITPRPRGLPSCRVDFRSVGPDYG